VGLERIFGVKASLVFVLPDGAQKELTLKKSRFVLGRQEGVQIRLNSASISRQHCEFVVDDAGITIKDLGSSNGTYVNKRRITQTVLAAGDLVSVGNHVLVVRMDGSPTAISSTDSLQRGLVAPGGASPSSLGSGGVAVAKPKGPAPAKRPVADDDLLADVKGPDGPGGDADKDSSSEWDFDFLDGKDKDMPKL
jgi:predicted component of type VI protein secretion system